jgi:hypothetical protein
MRWVKNDDPQAAINNKPELTANVKTGPTGDALGAVGA